jgi:hypothetical protein
MVSNALPLLTDESSTYILLPVAARYKLRYVLNCAILRITLYQAISRQTLA